MASKLALPYPISRDAWSASTAQAIESNFQRLFGATGATSDLGDVVTQILAGTNVTVNPVTGIGVVTVNASGGGGGGGDITPDSIIIGTTGMKWEPDPAGAANNGQLYVLSPVGSGGVQSLTLLGGFVDFANWVGLQLAVNFGDVYVRAQAAGAGIGLGVLHLESDTVITLGKIGATPTFKVSELALSEFQGVATSGFGLPIVFVALNNPGLTAASTIGAYSVDVEGLFQVAVFVNVTTATTHAFMVTVSYTDVGGTARVQTLAFMTLAGAFVTSIANAAGTVPYTSVSVLIRAQAASLIRVDTVGTFTAVVYDTDVQITQTA